ncbi:hypothetical protein BDQ12DRAFT_726248 [Crucibulum laeve]|uniref:CxC2-like cysteine cluster KDZ transposase-associated domain-containing protein n=1 Tax=Crucibulum laeve TaxID=68775 RepID=A0A5C3LSR6_9AGAR|nr:hypothetical protein BDQ12DRAFT_726248 [Crucibulum laeve]
MPMTTPLDAFDGAFSLSDPVIETDQSAKTQTSETLRLFEEMLPMIEFEILSHEANPLLNTPYCVKQLLRAGLFPSTTLRPVMAFTFEVLDQFHLHHLESKESAYDFIGALWRLTDNAFAHDISNPYPQFRIAMRVWRIIVSWRHAGNLSVVCPSCPELHVNMEHGWQKTPLQLCHLNQKQETLDGNHHNGKYAKNSDPGDISLFEGKSLMPLDSAYKEYLKNVPKAHWQEKSTCSHLNALNKQDRKKFKNMDITGVVNLQCSHVFIKASVDLQFGERFANVDYALALALWQHCHLDGLDNKFITSCDHLVSYDIACAYWVHVVERFEINFPNLVPAVKKIRWLIPAVHVLNHKDNCIYVHAAAYTPLAGHFHGETAEHYWAECNQLGPQTRQMNNGHRQDTLIDHHNDWNWKKTAIMSSTLYNDILNAKKLFIQKQAFFNGLSELYTDKVSVWTLEDWSCHVKNGKEIECVYRHNQRKVPSQEAIYQIFLNNTDDSNTLKAIDATATYPTVLLNEGIYIQSLQQKIKSRIAYEKRHGVEAVHSEIEDRHKKLRVRIDKWRNIQKGLMHTVTNHVLSQTVTKKTLDKSELEMLFLPLDFTESQRLDLNLVALGQSELKLREGCAFDAICSVCNIVKMLSALHQDKNKNARSQDQNTWAQTRISEAEARRDAAIDSYCSARNAMISLGMDVADPSFPPLTVNDTIRKSTHVNRVIGDSRVTDGLLWTQTGVTTGAHTQTSTMSGSSIMGSMAGTMASKPKQRIQVPNKNKKGTKRQVAMPAIQSMTEDGWIWCLEKMGRLSAEQIEEWIQEGDRVQWFRAEAEMQRWLEEWEIKQADFMRCIRSFSKMHEVWTELATRNSNVGHITYAKQKVVMYATMEREAKHRFALVGYGDRILKEDEILADLIQKDRISLRISPYV